MVSVIPIRRMELPRIGTAPKQISAVLLALARTAAHNVFPTEAVSKPAQPPPPPIQARA
jgi:hypothetical protein